MSLAEYASSSIPVVAQQLSNSALSGIQALTTQTELLLVLTVEVIIVLYGIRVWLASWFARTDYMSDTIERVVLRFFDLFIFIAGFVVFTLLMNVANEVYETTLLRVNDLLTLFFLLFLFIFLLIEKFRSDATPAGA